jgi:SPW repeat
VHRGAIDSDSPVGDAMLDIRWTTETLLDLIKLTCAALLLASPLMLEFPPTAVWNLWVCAYAILTVTVAALTAEADWEPHSNFCLGIWVAIAPLTLGFSQDAAAVFVHVFGGSVISLLSAIEVWRAERNPPWHFSPAAALRAPSAMMATEMPQPLQELAAARGSHRRRRPAAMGRTLRRPPSHARAKRHQARLRLAVTDEGHLRQGFTFLKARLNQAYRGR